MIVGAAFCPVPPVMVPSLGGAAAEDLAELRDACLAAIGRVTDSQPEMVLILGASDSNSSHSPVDFGDLAGLGRTERVHLGSPACGGSQNLSQSLTIAAWLVHEAMGVRTPTRGFGVAENFETSSAGQQLLELVMGARVALVVAGDGSARREKASPGYLDERAVPFDAAVTQALREGDWQALASIDAALGSDLMAAGTLPWRVTGELFAGMAMDAELHYADAPFGVGYVVASWLTGEVNVATMKRGASV